MHSLSSALANLTPVQSQVAALLAAGATITETAAECGITRQTIYTWQKTVPAFADALTRGREEYEVTYHDDLARLTQLAMDTLKQVILDEKSSPSLKVRAALAILKRPPQDKPSPWQPPVAPVIAPVVAPETAPDFTKSDTFSDSVKPIPRGAPCPCGSGQKYKRCCGRNAPPVLHQTTLADEYNGEKDHAALSSNIPSKESATQLTHANH